MKAWNISMGRDHSPGTAEVRYSCSGANIILTNAKLKQSSLTVKSDSPTKVTLKPDVPRFEVFHQDTDSQPPMWEFCESTFAY